MGVPKKRKTHARQGTRRSHHALKNFNLIKCPKCGEKILPHRMCSSCGYYRGRMIIDVVAKLDKKERKKKEKELAQKEKEAKKSTSASTEKREGEAERPLSIEELSKKR